MMNFRTLDLNLLRVFDTVMAEGSLTRAAAVLALTQPAASHALKRLHQALGETLFVRTATGMRPTPRALALWPQIRSALATMQHSLAPDAFDPRTDAVSFNIAMADATAARLAPAMVAAIERDQAQANLKVLPLTTRDPRRLLELGEADLAVGYFPDAIAALLAQSDAATLRHQRLYETRYVCVMRKGHALARKRLTLNGYCDAHHLRVSFSGRGQGLVDRALAALGKQRRIVLTVNQFFTAGRVVTQSDLLTVLPLSFIAETGYQPDLVTRELPFDLASVAVEVMWHLRKDHDPAHRWLRQVVIQAGALGPVHATDARVNRP
jgi:DNA-binding transcriptional LysR family regulator